MTTTPDPDSSKKRLRRIDSQHGACATEDLCERVRQSRVAQGLPSKITDPEALRTIASALLDVDHQRPERPHQSTNESEPESEGPELP